jgi:nucleolin
MSNKLFITNISWSTSEEELRGLFESVGTVESIKLPFSPQTGRNKGYAFVVMSTDEEAQAAITQFTGYNLGGRELTLTFQDESRRIATEPLKTNKLFVRNLSPAATGDDLYNLFSQAGQVSSLQVPVDRENGQHRGFAFVEMGTEDEAEKVIAQFNETTVNDTVIQIVYQDPRRLKARQEGPAGGRFSGPKGPNPNWGGPPRGGHPAYH